MGRVNYTRLTLPFEDPDVIVQEMDFIADYAEGLLTPLVVGAFYAINQGHAPDIFSHVMYEFHQSKLDFREMISLEESTEETYALLQSSDDYLDNHDTIVTCASVVFSHLKGLYSRIRIPDTTLDRVVEVILGTETIVMLVAA